MAEGNSVTGIKVVLLGDAATGKSSLLTRFTTGEFNAHSDSTIGAAFKSKSAYVFTDSSCRVLAQGNKCIRLDIWDTAGQERYRSILPMYYRNAAAAVLVVDITQSESLKVADRWIMDIRQKTDGADCYVILAANKVDLPDRKISLEEITSFCEEKSIDWLETSALSGYQVDVLFERICEHCVSNSDSVDKPENVIQCSIQKPVEKKGCC